MNPGIATSEAVLLVLEPYAPWPATFPQSENMVWNGVAITQKHHESSGELLRRAQEGLDLLGSKGCRVSTILFCVNQTADEQSLNSRALLAQALVRFVQLEGGELVLVAPIASPAARADLAVLASTLSEMLVASGVTVRVTLTETGDTERGRDLQRARGQRSSAQHAATLRENLV